MGRKAIPYEYIGQKFNRWTIVAYKGETHTLQQWADKVGIKANTIHNRIANLGWSLDEALSRKPSRTSRKYNKAVV